MKGLLYIFIVSLIGYTSFAWSASHEHEHGHEREHGHEHHDHSAQQATDTTTTQNVKELACGNTIDVKVNGLVCDFCARALEKVVGKRDDVSDIQVDLDNGKVVIGMNEGKTIDDATLTTLILNSGYNVVEIDRGC